MRGVRADSPTRIRKTCPACGSIAIRRNKKYYKCVLCGLRFNNPGKVIINKKEA